MQYYNENVQQLLDVCQKLHTQNLVTAYGGNVSIRVDDRIIISPSGFPLGMLKQEDLMVINLEGQVVDGKNKPSSEKLMHLKIYQQRPEIRGIVHTHQKAASSFACLNRKIMPLNPESKMLISDMPIVPYFRYGTKELAEAVEQNIQDTNVVLLEKHGLVTMGKDIYHAFHLAELVEETAMMNIYVKLLED